MDPSILSAKIYDKIVKKYTELFFWDKSDDEIVDYFLKLLPKKAKILDVGCGPGGDVKYFIEKGFKAEGIDLSKEMINTARNLVPEGKFKVMDMRKLHYSNDHFDAVFAAYSLIHIPGKEIEIVLKEFHRVLKLHGFLFIAVQEGIGEKFVKEPLKEDEMIFVKYFTEDELRSLLTKTGFKILKIERRMEKRKGEFSSNKLFVIAQKI